MKMFVAFCQHGGNSNSGLKTREGAEEWAAKQLAEKPQVAEIVLTEIVGTLKRTTPVIEFFPIETPTVVSEVEEAKIGNFDQLRKSA